MDDPLATIDAFNPVALLVGLIAAQIMPTLGSFLAFGLGHDMGLDEVKSAGGCFVVAGYIVTVLAGVFTLLVPGLRWAGGGVLLGVALRLLIRTRR